MNKAELRNLLTKYKLDRIADDLMALARPAIRIQTELVDESKIAIGASKMGGLPDLPVGAEWPANHTPMAFIGQFNLAEIRALDIEGLLPESGLLSFFYQTQEEARYGNRFMTHEQALKGWKVLYLDADPSTFVRHTEPDELESETPFQSCAVQFTQAWTLPQTDSPELESLNLSAGERNAYIEIDSKVNSGDYGEQQLLGYGYYLDMTPFLAAANREREWMNIEPEKRIAIERDINARWLNLFQLQNSPDLDMAWIDSGIAHFSIEREALRQRDFSGVWVDLDFI